MEPLATASPIEMSALPNYGITLSRVLPIAILAIAVPIKSRETKTVVKVFVQEVVLRYGPPEELYCDGAAEFRSELITELVRMFGVSRHITTPYHPQANGQIERVFATVRPMLASMVGEKPRNWDEILPFVVFAYNTSYHRSVRNTPFYLMYGRDPSLGVYGLEETLGEPIWYSNQQRLEQLHIARDVALRHINQEAGKRKEYYDKTAKPVEFLPGDVVMLKSILPPNTPAGKLYPWYVGPYRVVRVVGDAVLGVVPIGYTVKNVRYIHSNRARLSMGDCTPNSSIEELKASFPAIHEVDPNLDVESPDG